MKNTIQKIKELIRKTMGIDEAGIADQLRKPSGWLASRVGKQMNESNRAIYDTIFGEMKAAARGTALEIGFGNGLFFPRYFEQAKNGRVFGLELSEKMVEAARMQNKKENRAGLLELSVGSSKDMPYADASFDIVVCVNVIYFWDYPAEHLREIYRVLKPGGLFYVGMRPEESLKNVPFAKHGFILYSETEWRDRVQEHKLLHIKTSTFSDRPINLHGVIFPIQGMVMLFQKVS